MLSITLLESSHKENYNSQNSHIKTPNKTQRLLKTKLKECFMYLHKVARIIISVVYLLNLLPLFITYHLGMMVLLGIYRRFGKTWEYALSSPPTECLLPASCLSVRPSSLAWRHCLQPLEGVTFPEAILLMFHSLPPFVSKVKSGKKRKRRAACRHL